MTKETDIVNDVTQRFAQVASKFARTESLPIRVNADHVVSVREAHVIEAIGKSPSMNVTKLATYFGTTRSAASQMVSKLEKRGLIIKAYAPNSAKEYQLSLTPLGQEAFDAHERVHGAVKDMIIARMQSFSVSQLSTLSVFMDTLNQIMDERLEQKEG